jgi:dienelactone hydrolase
MPPGAAVPLPDGRRIPVDLRMPSAPKISAANDRRPGEIILRIVVERLAAAGYDAQITVYPGARHAFDHPNSPAYNIMSDAQTSRDCMRREEKDG